MLRVDNVSVAFDGCQALAGTRIEVAEGETLAVLGPSGSGKTTLLRVIAGLTRPDCGRVLLDGRDVTAVPAHARGIGLMFQDGVLFPHRDVAGNVEFGLRIAGVPREQRRRRVAEVLELVGLRGFEQRPVATLSGGEQQRVALSRALAPAPRALLLDEPLGSLDGPLRARLLDDLAEVFEAIGLTAVHVTHDVGEAFALGHRVAVMLEGRVVQCAPPDELWTRPRDEWTARFLGMTNVCELDGRRVVVRPEAVRLRRGDDVTVLSVERRGAVVHVRVRGDDGDEFEAVTTELDHPRAGGRVTIDIDPAGVVELEERPSPG
ncbi:MAG: ABC transporter ATP-binding protein [Actinobacteria bacterium]|nr:ABC transporter ATP-binding protein [Actinomycetota bacterium]